ncbi:MAG: KilA-N domain-containing protein [Chloroflexi bacterium]|nr:KilA-N domain-containing protein [Chloroflexota bacterium]MYD46962.1 KilA-N domain-containing protein [Chloroflexota bacterium]
MKQPYSKALIATTPKLWIEHPVEGGVVPQRPTDGYINATRLCEQVGKRFYDYSRLAQTQAFLDELALETGIPVSNLLQVIRGRGDTIEQGTWVHPQVAVNLGQWLSPTFAVQVSKWVFDWMAGKTNPYMPVHVQRYLKNQTKIPHTHFSMLNEIYLGLLAPLEANGVIPTDRMMPDISTGRMFSDFLRSKGIDPTAFPTYPHEFVDQKRPTVEARLYPVEHLADFRRWFHDEWLPNRAEIYFEDKLPQALPYLESIKALPEA